MNKNNQIISAWKNARSSMKPCRPPLWASTGHLQTILGHLIPSESIREQGEHLNVTLEKEEERIHTTLVRGSSRTVVYLFHGLGGSADADYMQRTANIAHGLGHHVFLNNHRGCGLGMGLASEPYHSGRAEDLSKVIEFGREKFPDHFHLAIGFSLSANALLLLAAGYRAAILPDAAIAVNAPIVLDVASRNLSTGLNRIYDFRFLQELKNHIKRNNPDQSGLVRGIWNTRSFDDAYTAPKGGFKNKEDYYQTCSAKQFMPDIKIPTVMLTAADDPFVSVSDYRDAIYSSNVILHVEEHGGHMGYLTQNGKGFSRWQDYALKAYLESLIEVA